MKRRSGRIVGILGILFPLLVGGVMLFFQAARVMEHRALRSGGQRITGALKGVTRHRVNFIPMGYSFEVSYAGRTKTFDVSRDVYLRYTRSEDKFTPDEPVEVVYLPDRPDVAELPEMLDLWFWWFGGPVIHVPMGVIFAGIGFAALAAKISSWRSSRRRGSA